MNINSDPSKSNFQFKLPPQGLHNARIAWILDLGTQVIPAGKNYPSKEKPKLKISYELVDTNETFKEGEAPKPFFVSREYIQSILGVKNNLRDMLLSIMGRPIQPTEDLTAILKSLVGTSCMIQVIHAPDKNDATKIFANIQNVMPNPNPNCNPLRNPTIFFDMTQPSCVTEYPKINGKATLEKIHSSPEFKALVASGRIVQRPTETNQHNSQQQQPQQQFQAPPQQQFQQQSPQGAWQAPQPQWGAPPQQPQNAMQPNQQFMQQAPVASVPPPAQPQWHQPQQQPLAPVNPQLQQQNPAPNPFQQPQPQFNQQQQAPVNPFAQPVMVANPAYNPNIIGSKQFVPTEDDIPF